MLLERHDLLGELAELVENASHGSGSLVLLAGEAGAGKSALVRAHTASLGPYTRVIEGACDPLTTPRPLSPLYDFVDDASGWLADLDLGDDVIAVFREVLAKLKSSTRPVVMVIEDVHWADEATLDFLRFIGRRVAASMAVVICTYRDDEIGPDHPFSLVLGQLVPLTSTVRLKVPALTLAAVSALAADTNIDARTLHKLTGGNAFFVTEVIASGSSLPATVHDAVLARVASLPTDSREVIEAVSIAPRGLEVEHALHLAAELTNSVDRAVSSGVILSNGHLLRFRHELARAAVEDTIPPARRYDLHGRMLALLQQQRRVDHARLAHHAQRAHSPELVIEHAPMAARLAAARGARREAAKLFWAVLEHSHALAADDEAQLRFELGRELSNLDRPEEAIEELDRALAYIRNAQDELRLAEVLMERQRVLWSLGRLDAAWAAGRELIDLLRPRGPSAALGMAVYRQAHHHMLARHAVPAQAAAEEAIAIGTEVGNTDVLWLATMIRGTTELIGGNALAGLEQLRESRAQAVKLGNVRFESTALSMLGSGGGEYRLYEPALRALNEGIRLAIDSDMDLTYSYEQAWKARIAFEQGRWDDAIDEAREAMRVSARNKGITYLTAMGSVGRVRIRRGDPGGPELLTEVLASGKTNELQHIWSTVAGLAEYHWLRGEQDDMKTLLRTHYARALDTDSVWARGELGFWLWRAGELGAPPPKAAEPFALQMAGDWRAAAEAWREIGCPYEVALALADGDSDAMLEAVSIFDTLGAGPMARRTRDALKRAGVTAIPRGPRRSTRTNLKGLTDRQLQVLELIAEGRSNAEIATALRLSRKTVEHHVSAILDKLGVANRQEASDALSGERFET